MKRILALTLALLMALSLTACGKKTSDAGSSDDNVDDGGYLTQKQCERAAELVISQYLSLNLYDYNSLSLTITSVDRDPTAYVQYPTAEDGTVYPHERVFHGQIKTYDKYGQLINSGTFSTCRCNFTEDYKNLSFDAKECTVSFIDD